MTEAQINVEKEQTEQEVNIEREPFSIGGGGHDYTAGEGLKLDGYEFSADTDVLATKSDLSGKQDTLTAGENISIENNTISATDTTYTAGDNITISDDNVISATGSAQVQSDWAENDSTDLAFVQNRPLFERIIENSIEQANTTDAGSTPDSNYVWFIEQVMDYSLASVLSGFADGDKFKVAITYSVNGTENTDNGNFILSFDGDAASLDYDAPTGNRWYGAYLAEINDATTIRFPVPASAVGSTVYITNIEYEYVKKVDGKYLPVDGESIILNDNGELESTNSGSTLYTGTGTNTDGAMTQLATSQLVYPGGDETTQTRVQIGYGAAASTEYNYTIAIGYNAKATAAGAVAIGRASQTYGVAIGNNSRSTTSNGISIGGSSYSGSSGSIAIGNSARCSGKNSIALGASSQSNREGELSVGTASSTRFIANVREPELDQDAATKKYVDDLISALDNRIKALEGN